MKKNKTTKKIVLRTFSAWLAAYLVLMTGFSIFLLQQEKKVQSLQYGSYAMYINNTVEEILKDNIDSNNQVIDISKVRKECVKRLAVYAYSEMEIALFSRDYNLIFNTDNEYLLCSFAEHREGNQNDTGYAYLKLEDWFDEEEVTELNHYLSAEPKAKKTGDLSSYSIQLDSFWLDNEMIIPEKIAVVPMYAISFDEEGRVEGSSGSQRSDLVFTADDNKVKGLPHFQYGNVLPRYRQQDNQIALRNMVMDKEKLQEAVSQVKYSFYERENLVTYRLYMTLPYQNTVKSEGTNQQNFYAEFWTVIGIRVNLLEKSIGTLLFVWLSCFLVFAAATFILSMQTCKIYKKREEIDQYHRETTNALAHDLKTPLSIISGYAQNLVENIHTEKREYYASNINLNVARMDRIIQEMLELSKYEMNLFQLKLEEVSLGEVCNKLLDRYHQVCNEKHITASLEGNAIVKADFSLMERVMDNFFVNALDHTPEGGTIRIRIFDRTLEFYNSGSHIPEDIINEIWKPYKKAEVSRSNTKGTGLGLSIASKILDLYEFSYGAKNVEQGVVFWFTARS